MSNEPKTFDEAMARLDVAEATRLHLTEMTLYLKAAECALRSAGLPIPRPDPDELARTITPGGTEAQIKAQADAFRIVWPMQAWDGWFTQPQGSGEVTP